MLNTGVVMCCCLQEHEELSKAVQGWKVVLEQLSAERSEAGNVADAARPVLMAADALTPRLLRRPADWLQVRDVCQGR